LLKGCLSTLTFHFEAAQEAYKEALRYLKREADPQLWAATQVEVGGTHAELGIRGEGRAANEHLTDAITAYRNALEVYTRERLPQDWAAVQTNLGNALQAQGLRTGGSQGNELLAKRWPPTAAPWRCIRPKASPLTTSEWRRIWRKQRTCLNRRRPLSERDFPSLAYISSSRTRVLKHHPGASAGHAPEARPSHSLKSRTCRNTSCSPSS
jgi:tetratricopeptide (TPR) repeat protein